MARQYKLARKMKKIALTAAAKEFGVSQPTLSMWESERRNPPIETLIHMAEFYQVSVDFLLGLSTQSDPRSDLLRPISPDVLPALHERPVYLPEYGWAFVDAIEKQLHFASGLVLPLVDAKEVYFIPPSFSSSEFPEDQPLDKDELQEEERVWVEPLSPDTVLRDELRGWYSVKSCFVQNEVGQRFYFDFYGAKWLAFRRWSGE